MKGVIKKALPGGARTMLRQFQWRAGRFGLKHRCLMCGAWLKDFEPRGATAAVLADLQITPGGYRRVTCPHCHSYDRERLLYLFLRDRTDIFTKRQKVLHFSPELCIAERLAELGHQVYATVDLFPMPGVAVLSDICRLSFRTDAFDCLICCHVLEHIIEDRAAMTELLRVVKPGGWAVLQVPVSLKLDATFEDPAVTTDEDRMRVFGQGDHVRIYAMDYIDRLRESGWQVEIVDLIAEMGHAKARKLGLFIGERIFLGRKPA